MSRDTPNLRRIRLVAKRLGPLVDRFAFLGGAVTEFLVTDPAAPPPRPTLDVDAIVEVGTRGEFIGLQDALRRQGFFEDASEGAPICRWKCEGVRFDVMPTDERMLGFSNRWYPLASRLAEPFALDGSTTIRLVTAPCFLATKLEAFRERGNGDYVASHDLEDIVAVIDGRASVAIDIEQSDPRIREYLAGEVRRLLTISAFTEAIAGHLSSDGAGQARLPIVVERMRTIAGIAAEDRPAGRELPPRPRDR